MHFQFLCSNVPAAYLSPSCNDIPGYVLPVINFLLKGCLSPRSYRFVPNVYVKHIASRVSWPLGKIYRRRRIFLNLHHHIPVLFSPNTTYRIRLTDWVCSISNKIWREIQCFCTQHVFRKRLLYVCSILILYR